jgi:hypothetical protein
MARRGDHGRARAAHMRCPECGAEPAETAQVCVRCGAPVGLQQPVAAAPATGPQQIRCLECGAEPAETAQVCVRCGAPAGLQQPVAAASAAGGSGSAIAPLAEGTPDGSPGQRTGPGYSRRKALVAGGVGAVMLTGLITVIGVTNSSTPATNQLTWDQLQPGDCLAGSNMGLGTGSRWPDSVTAAACTKRHIAEVFFAGNIWAQSLAYPGEDAIDTQSDARCNTAFAAYDGTDNSQSAFTFDYIIPDSSDWASGGRSLVCVAYEPSSSGPSGGTPVDYSIKDSNK